MDAGRKGDTRRVRCDYVRAGKRPHVTAKVVTMLRCHQHGSEWPLATGSTSTGAADNGVGQLIVADVTTPSAMAVVTTVPVPNTSQLFAPVLQGPVAVALGDTGGWTASGGFEGAFVTTYLGNLTLTTFDISNPRSPTLLANIVLPYTNFSAGPAVQIGPYPSLFGGVQDNSGNNLLLLVDTTNPLVPVVTPYSIPVGATNFTAVGTLLHVSAGAAGYAVYQIPGVTPTQFGLTGACANPVSWTLNPPSLGTLSASGLYPAPASVISVNLSQALTLTLTASTPDPTFWPAPPVSWLPRPIRLAPFPA
jgi:hypothetical protein